jgi:hypothetical protein
LGNQTDGHQARVVMALGDDKNIILNVFIDHVPRIFATLFGAADAQPFTLAQRMVHQPLMGTDLLAVDGENFARLRRQIAAKEIAEFTFADKADAGGIFFFAVIRSSSSAILRTCGFPAHPPGTGSGQSARG